MSIFVMPQASAYGQNVKPYDGAKLYFYEAGTTTDKTAYKDSDETVAHAQPVVADGSGRFDAIFISGIYKTALYDKNDVLIWTEDNLSGFGNSWSIQGDFDSSTNAGDYPSSGQNGYVYRVTEAFTLNAVSGAYKVNIGDYIIANKNGATGINADWDIIRGVNQTISTVALTDGATIATDCSKGTTFTVTLGGDRTLSNPTNKLPGQTYTWLITQDATGSRTLAFGTDFVFDSTSKIKPEAAAVTIIQGVAVSATVVRCNVVRNMATDFDASNLLINVASNTTVTVTADRIKFLSDSGDFVTVDNVSETFDITTDLMTGTTEKNSHQYPLWASVTGTNGTLTRKMVPDLESTTDGTTASKLVDSAADFVTDKVAVGDIVYNLTDYTQTTVTAVDDLNTLSLADDIFVSGEDYKIHLLSPTGLGAYKANIGMAFNNSSGNLDDSGYTRPELQKPAEYSEAAGDFSVTGTNWTTSYAYYYPFQILDFSKTPVWLTSLHIKGAMTAAVSNTLATTGLLYANILRQGVDISSAGVEIRYYKKQITGNSNEIDFQAAANITEVACVSPNARLTRKPTWATRS